MNKLTILIVLFLLVVSASSALAFDLRNYFNYDILRNSFQRSTQNFNIQELSPVHNSLFQQFSDKIYNATGINILNIWVGVIGFFSDLLSKTAELLKSLL